MPSHRPFVERCNKGFIIPASRLSREVTIMSTEKMPIKALEQHLNDEVSIKLKDQRVFKGRLTRCDVYMNLTLSDAEELQYNADGAEQTKAKYGEILLRGNNILWIRIPE